MSTPTIVEGPPVEVCGLPGNRKETFIGKTVLCSEPSLVRGIEDNEENIPALQEFPI